jgi:hypothetical protein
MKAGPLLLQALRHIYNASYYFRESFATNKTGPQKKPSLQSFCKVPLSSSGYASSLSNFRRRGPGIQC